MCNIRPFFKKKCVCRRDLIMKSILTIIGELWGPSGTVCEDQKLLLSCSMCWIWNTKVGALPRMPKTLCIIGHVSSEVCHAVARSENFYQGRHLGCAPSPSLALSSQTNSNRNPQSQTGRSYPRTNANIKDDTCKPHWLLSCDSSESMLN